jgi:hypothetical protein
MGASQLARRRFRVHPGLKLPGNHPLQAVPGVVVHPLGKSAHGNLFGLGEDATRDPLGFGPDGPSLRPERHAGHVGRLACTDPMFCEHRSTPNSVQIVTIREPGQRR